MCGAGCRLESHFVAHRVVRRRRERWRRWFGRIGSVPKRPRRRGGGRRRVGGQERVFVSKLSVDVHESGRPFEDALDDAARERTRLTPCRVDRSHPRTHAKASGIGLEGVVSTEKDWNLKRDALDRAVGSRLVKVVPKRRLAQLRQADGGREIVAKIRSICASTVA